MAASATLAAAGEDEREALANFLVDRAGAAPVAGWRGLVDRLLSGSGRDPRAQARAELVRRWAWLPREARERAVILAGSWEAAARVAAGDPDPGVRASAALAAGRLSRPEALEACLPLLADADSVVSREAERALVRCATRAIEDPADRGAIERVVARAARAFGEHRRHGALLAAVFLLDGPRMAAARRGAGGPLAAWATGEPDDGHAAMRSALRKANHPLARRRALEWLANDAMATAAMDRLNRARDREEHEAVLEAWPLTLRPCRRERLGMIRPKPGTGDGPLPPAPVARGLSEPARIGLCHWMAHVRLKPEERRPLAERALTDPSPRVRWTAMRIGSAEDLEDFAFDPDGRIAGSALLRLSGAGDRRVERGSRAEDAWVRADRLTRHPDAGVRALAASEVARLDPWAGRSAAAVCARLQLRDDPERFVGELRARIADGETSARVQAMALAQRLGLSGRVEEQLLEAVRQAGPAALAAVDDEARQRLERAGATAVVALGALSSDSSHDALAGALRHTSARVRANAIEAMAQRRRRGPAALPLRATLTELKTDAAHRVRANAILALLRGADGVVETERVYEPGAAEQLGAMLGDDRPMHRIAGLWVAARLLTRGAGAGLGRQWTPLAARLADLARSDDDPAVRQRAAACVRKLQVEVRSGWRGRAPSVNRGAPVSALRAEDAA